MNKLTPQLYEIIKTLPYDLRIEVVMADLVERGLNQDNIIISSKGLFKRRLSRDVEQVSPLNIDRRSQYVMAEVNREGIYDALPQAITHSAKRSKKPTMKTVVEMVGELKERRAEENAARHFFLPFENEFHQQCIDLEIEERNILRGFLSNSRYTQLMNEFWQLPSILNERQKATFIYLVPIVYKAAGNLSLTRICYEAILNIKVNFSIKSSMEQKETNFLSSEDGCLTLGTNFVCGNRFHDCITYYEIQLGPLNEVHLQTYLPGGNGREVVEFLNSYYLPFNTENKLKILTEPGLNEFVLNEPTQRLAYTTYI